MKALQKKKKNEKELNIEAAVEHSFNVPYVVNNIKASKGFAFGNYLI